MVKKMPGGDGTGPNGQGPLTGRGMGYCGGNPTPGFVNPGRGGFGMGRGYGRGFGRGNGRGMGRAWGNPYWGVPPPPAPIMVTQPPFQPPMNEENYKVQLENQVQVLSTRLEQLQAELEKMNAKKE